MLATTIAFLTQLWLQYGSVAVTCTLWALVGFAVLSPMLLVDAVYQARKVGDSYHFSEGLHLKRARHKKDALVYGALSALFLAIVLLIGSW